MTTEPKANSTGAESVAEVRAPQVAASWTTGLARFADLAMALLGVLYTVAGPAHCSRAPPPCPAWSTCSRSTRSPWCWIHLVAGALVGLADMAITGTLWGRVIGVVLTAVAIGVSFLSLPRHPALTILGIMLGFAVVWAFRVFDEEAPAASPTILR